MSEITQALTDRVVTKARGGSEQSVTTEWVCLAPILLYCPHSNSGGESLNTSGRRDWPIFYGPSARWIALNWQARLS